MDKKFLPLIVSLVLSMATVFPLTAQVDCYSSSRKQGVALMEQGHYSEAIQVFQSAKSCPDKPADNDLQAKISECSRLLRKQQEPRRMSREEMERRMRENERKRDEEFAAKGYMEVTGLSFANASADDQYLGEPGDPLYENDIRHIKPVLSYRGLSREQKMVELGVKFIDPEGAPVGGEFTPDGYSYKHTVTVSPYGGRISIPGWGSRKGGVYSAGIYTCEIWCNGNLLTSGHFTVLQNADSHASGYFTVTGLSLANTTFDNQILDPYGSTLHSDDIRFLKAKIRYDSDQSRRIDLSVVIHSPDGTEMTDSDSYFVQRGANQEMTLTGLGARRMSLFAPGTHRYEIWYDGKRIYSQSFYVVETSWRAMMDRVMDQATNTDASGKKYRGDLGSFDTGWEPDGLGVMYWPGGTYYWGEWSEGFYEGEGIYLLSSTYQIPHCPGCSIYVGSYVKNKKSGWGACYDQNGDLVYEGGFIDDAPTGPFPTPAPSGRRFEIRKAEGGYYVGEILDGKRDGKGILVQSTGEAWYGDWKDGVRRGEGLALR